MKITLLFPVSLACALLTTQTLATTDVATGWRTELDAVQQTVHQEAGGRARADAILGAVLYASRNGLAARETSGRPAEAPPAGANLEAAAAQGAYAVLAVLYPQSLPAFDARLAESLAGITDTPAAIGTGREWGQRVAAAVLADQSDAVFLNLSSFARPEKTPANPTLVPDVQAEQATIGPGRYRFDVLAGAPGTTGYVDGTGAAARFDHPNSLAVDLSGHVYVSESDLGVIRKISPAGVVTTLAGAAGQNGSQDGMGSAARFNGPTGLAVDGAGNLYVADTGNNTIRKIDPSGNVTTLAGKAGEPGYIDGDKATARLSAPTYLAADDAGNVFFVEYPSNPPPGRAVRKVTPDGTVSRLTIKPVDPYLWMAQLVADHTGVRVSWHVARAPLWLVRGFTWTVVAQSRSNSKRIVSEFVT